MDRTQDGFVPETAGPDERVRALEQRLAETEAALQALITAQVGAQFVAGDVTPMLNAENEKALEAAKQALEMKMAKRTAELEQANAALKSANERLRATNGQLEESNRRLAVSNEALARVNQQLAAEGNERRGAEEAIKHANERFRSVLSSITEAYFALDYEFHFLEVNPVAEQIIFKRPESELVGKGFWDVFPQGIGSKFYHEYHRAVAEGIDVHFEGQSQIVDKWFEAHAYPRNGRLEVYFRDITERKRAVQQLEAERARLEAVLRHLPVGVMIAEAPTGRLVLGNEQVEKIWRHSFLPAEGVEEYRKYQGFHPDGRTYHPEEWPLARSIQAGEVVIAEEIDILRGDGSRGTILVDSTPIHNAAGQVVAGVGVFQDITERKKMEALLRSSNEALQSGRDELEQRVEARTRELSASKDRLAEANEVLRAEVAERQRAEAFLRQVLDIMPVGVWLVDREGRLVEANPAANAIWAGTKLVGLEEYGEYKAWRLDNGALITAEEWAAARAITRGEISLNEEIEIECFDDTHKIILNSAIPLRDEQGEIAGAIIVNEDITGSKRAEQELRSALEALRASEERLRTVVNSAPIILWAMDPHGKVTLLEGRALATLGLQAGDQVSKSVYNQITDRPDIQEYLRRAQAGEEVSGVAVTSFDGQEVFEAHYGPYYDPDGQVAGVIGVSTKITERVRAEEALRKANEQLAQANEDLEARVSARSAELTARTAQLGQAIQRLGEAYKRLAQTNRELEKAKLELEWELAERERAERALEEYTLQLERTNRDLQDFASIASHDLQEPLRKIQAFGDRLMAKAAPRLGEDERDYLNRMVRAAAQMSTMIRALMSYSQVETRARPYTPVDLNGLVVEVISTLEELLRQSGGHVLAESLPVVQADPLQMRQLFHNLLSNALKFHMPGVPPRVRVYARQPAGTEGTRGDPEEVEIIVEDNGIGFEEKYAERIFQPFQRLVGRGEFEGSGIGLAICRKIVERHRGAIEAHSVPGQGTQVIVRLPRRQAEERRPKG